MAASKSKYQVSVTRLQRLPPIREESMSARTPQSAKRPNRDDNLTTDAKISVQPLQSKPTIHVRPLPRKTPAKVQFEPEGNVITRSETQILDLYPKTVYKEKPQEPTPKIKHNIDPQRTLVDGLVADYLHYAQYGHIIPVYEGTGSLACSCCTDRNRENVRIMLGFPTKFDKPPQNTVGSKIIGPNPKPDTWLTGSSRPAVKSPKSNPSPRFDDEVFENWSSSPRGKNSSQQSKSQEKWLDYQPKPYASSYASAEFNRPSVVYNHLRESNDNFKSRYSHEILDANTKYDDAMNKLAKFSFS